MNQARFFNRLEELYAICVGISRRKNADYAGDADPFKNFRLIELLTNGRITVEEGILVRISDKIQRVANLLEPGKDAQVVDESLLDTLSDAANYLMILRVYLEEKASK